MFFHNKKEPCSKQIIMWLTEKAKMLAFNYQEQCDNIEDFARWNLPEDIASDWYGYESFLANIEISDKKINQLIIRIGKSFDEVSINSHRYEDVIWTLEGLKNHPFWEEQRKLAKELLLELEKIKM